jgi:hypothetical protein
MWKKIRDWIKINGDAIKFVAWVLAGAVAGITATATYLAPYVHFSFPTNRPNTYTVDTVEVFAPQETKPLAAIRDADDTATKWEYLPVNQQDATIRVSGDKPILSSGRRRGYVVMFSNVAGSGMGHPNVNFTMRITCTR